MNESLGSNIRMENFNQQAPPPKEAIDSYPSMLWINLIILNCVKGLSLNTDSHEKAPSEMVGVFYLTLTFQ